MTSASNMFFHRCVTNTVQDILELPYSNLSRYIIGKDSFDISLKYVLLDIAQIMILFMAHSLKKELQYFFWGDSIK